MRRIIALCAAGLCLAPIAARASCSVTGTTIAFGTVGFSAVNSTGTVKVTCTGSASYTVALNAGGSGSFTTRKMTSGSNKLDYNIYTNSGHTTVWGDGTSGTSTNSGSFSSSGGNKSFTAYGQVPAQTVTPGSRLFRQHHRHRHRIDIGDRLRLLTLRRRAARARMGELRA